MPSHHPTPAYRPTVFPSREEAVVAADVTRCPVCGFRVWVAPDAGGFVLYCGVSRSHHLKKEVPNV